MNATDFYVSKNVSSEQKARLAVALSLQNNTQFRRRFHVRRVIGNGSNGVVLAAHYQDDTHEESLPVAVKIIYKNKATKLSGLPKEIDLLRKLSLIHELSDVIRYITHWEDEHHYFLVTELFGNDFLSLAPELSLHLQPFIINQNGFPHSLEFSSGSSDLWAWTAVHRLYSFKLIGHCSLPTQGVKQIARLACGALSRLHQAGYAHGDVKPENILLQYDACSKMFEVRLIDFGHTRPVGCPLSSYGTPDFQAPEFLEGSPYVRDGVRGEQADVFAMGMVIFGLVTEGCDTGAALCGKKGMVGYQHFLAARDGLYPFEGMECVDPIAADIINWMCWVDPMRRPSMAELVQHPWFTS
ncbi:kinase-like domain-containing protein [Chytriomyces sp. MP71]|nr:kinase-like domain-containing protein [Chytriomyces sp. MP71]